MRHRKKKQQQVTTPIADIINTEPALMMRTPSLGSRISALALSQSSSSSSSSSIRRSNRLFAAAALGTLAGSSFHVNAFVSPCRYGACFSTSPSHAITLNKPQIPAPSQNMPIPSQRILYPPSTMRLYSSYRNNNNYDNDDDDKDKNILQKAADKVKSFLPKTWFKDEKTKRAEIEKKRVREEVSGGLSEMLRDAPLPIKMMGKMISPLISNLASEVAQTMGEQARRMEDLLDDARRFIISDEEAVNALGEPITVGSPFSQSSSTTTINGKTTSKIQASFEVVGSYASGVATMMASEEGISSLQLNVRGRTYYVDLVGGRGGRGRERVTGSGPKSNLGKNRINKDDIIDVEFVEKK